jgi:DNA-binding SARP family transcriptional activator/tetratricopeptide (TPR) repeat protein
MDYSAMNHLDMRLIGIPEITLDGEVVQLRRRHSIALLAYLAITNRPHPRIELATFLAGDIEETSALKLLRNVLTDLSTHGLRDFLIVTRHTLAFNAASSHRLDIPMLDDIHRMGSAANIAGLEWVARQYGSELLSGLRLRDGSEFELWLLREREHRMQQVTHLTLQLLDTYIVARQTAEGIALAERVLAIEPWQEQVHRSLMLLFAQGGRLNEAREQYHVCRQLLNDELGVEPEPETVSLYQRLSSGPNAPKTNLTPASRMRVDQLIGHREQVTAIVTRLLEPTCQLLTLVGPQGSGKSSLALAVAWSLAEQSLPADLHPFADGVTLVSLGDIPARASNDDAQHEKCRLVTAIGHALGMVFYGNIDHLAQIKANLETKQTLIVLDQMEDLNCGLESLQSLLRHAPGVTVLATSPVALGIAGEFTHYVKGLALPSTIDDLGTAPAALLFKREAARVHASVQSADANALLRICRLTSGLPVPLMIAAGWLRAVSAAEVARQLEYGGDLLETTLHLEEDRSTSLMALMDDEWRLFSDNERSALEALAVFAGRFDHVAAAEMGVSQTRLLSLSRSAQIDVDEDDRYALEPLFRLYCRQQLVRDPDRHVHLFNKHATYFGTWLAEQANALRETRAAHIAIEMVLPDVQGAWDWCVQSLNGALLTIMMQPLSTWYSLAGQNRDWAGITERSAKRLRNALTLSEDPAVRTALVLVLIAQADALHRLGMLDEASVILEEARRSGENIDVPEVSARLYIRHSQVLHARGKRDQVISMLTEARNIARDYNIHGLESYALLILSLVQGDYGRYNDAIVSIRDAEKLAYALGQPVSIGCVVMQIGHLYAELGDFSRARTYLEQSRHIGQEFKDRYSEGWSSIFLGRLYGDAYGRHVEGSKYLDRATSLARKLDDLSYLSYLHWAYGRNLLNRGSLEQALHHFESSLEFGLDLGSPSSKSRALHGLGQVAIECEDYVHAEDMADQSYALALDAGRRPLAVSALIQLGQAREGLGLVSEASTAYSRAWVEARDLGSPFMYCEAVTGLANTFHAAGQLVQATQLAGEAFTFLEEHLLAGCDNPAWVAESCVNVFRAGQDPRADVALKLGSKIVQRTATALVDADRHQYLTALPAVRRLVAVGETPGTVRGEGPALSVTS